MAVCCQFLGGVKIGNFWYKIKYARQALMHFSVLIDRWGTVPPILIIIN